MAETQRRPPEEEGVVSDEWIAELVRRSTAAQGLPEYVTDPLVGEAVARILSAD